MLDALQSEAGVRLASFVGVFAIMTVWEILAPRRTFDIVRSTRWPGNLGLFTLNSVLMRLVAPLGAVGIAMLANDRYWGVFNVLETSYWISVPASVVLLDLAIYWQHVAFHAIPLFWRLHHVHHADLAIDATTGLRFHTLEVLLSFGIKAAVILALGPPAAAVLIFEILLNATSIFNHSNVDIPVAWDRILRRVVVTPDMHRVHHSWHPQETNSNYGFNLPCWDRFFGTYRDQPADGHDRMTIGLREIRNVRRSAWLNWLLWLPFVPNACRGSRRNSPSQSVSDPDAPNFDQHP